MPCLLLALGGLLHAQQPYTAGQRYFGALQYCEYRAGDLPVIITAGHGGRLEPFDIPDRNCAGCVTVMDGNTMELAYQIDTALRARMGGLPHVVISRLHRRKLDPNREIVEAANGNPVAEGTWREFHQFIIDAKKTARTTCGRALLIDLHGHGHTIQRLELGYLLDDGELRQSDATIDQSFANRAAIRYLAANNHSDSRLSALLRGPAALGTLLEQRNYPAVPSASQPAPLSGEPYFDGGYITARHGSRDSLTVDAIQIECHNTGVRNTFANRRAFASALANAIAEYLARHYPPFDCAGIAVNTGTPVPAVGLRPYWRDGAIYIADPPVSTYSWQLIDPLGRIVANGEAPGGTDRVGLPESLPGGVYWWQYHSGEGTKTLALAILR